MSVWMLTRALIWKMLLYEPISLDENAATTSECAQDLRWPWRVVSLWWHNCLIDEPSEKWNYCFPWALLLGLVVDKWPVMLPLNEEAPCLTATAKTKELIRRETRIDERRMLTSGEIWAALVQMSILHCWTYMNMFVCTSLSLMKLVSWYVYLSARVEWVSGERYDGV